MKGALNKLFLLIFICISSEIYSQVKTNESNSNTEKSPLGDLAFNSILYGNCEVFYSLNLQTTELSSQNPDKKYCKGFEVIQKFQMNQSEWNSLKLILLSKDTYLVGVIRSCYFVPDIGFEIEPDKNIKGVNKSIILLSRSCRKIFISNSNDCFTGYDGAFKELSQSGFENINNFIESRKDPFYYFENFYSKNNFNLYDPLMVNNQILLIELLLKYNDYEAIQFLHNDHFFSIMDKIIISNDILKELNMAFQKTRFRDDRRKIDSLLTNKQIEHIQHLIHENIVTITIAPQPAETVDFVPMSSTSAEDYLKEIEKIIKSNHKLKIKYTVESYLKCERENNITKSEEQILYRSYFIDYLCKELQK